MKIHYSLIAILFIIAGCATATPTPEPTAEVTESPYDVIDTICLVTDIGTISDGTFNQYAYEGMVSLAEDFPDLETSFVETNDPEDYALNIQTCLEREADIIVTVGFTLAEATLNAANDNPQVYFIGVDQNVASIENAPENFAGIQAAEHEAGFLVGVIAATLANEVGGDVIGGVYGIDLPAVVRFRHGYEQGALYVNPDWEIGVNILGQYTESFIDEELGASIAQDYIDEGAVVIFGAGGLTGSGAVVEATSQGVYGIGVDQDEYFTTFEGGEREGVEYLVTSAIKRVDRGVYDVASLLIEGQLEQFPGSSNYILDVISNGVGFAPSHDADIPETVFETASETFGLLLRGELQTGVDPVTGELLATAESTEEATEESE